ncbi:MAG TPA: ATP-binding protein [Candidatus Saccharimonadales bacterium]|nr:ATP-binding protein [Candidatus Saccharimonadales bacterium]
MQPTLFLLVGYPGAGKTTASRYIHELTGAVHLWADHERNTRFANPTHDHDENLKLYAQLNKEAEELLLAGKSVIFDTNFNFYKDRKKLKIIAAKAGARAVVVWMTTPKGLARIRATVHAHDQSTRIWGNMPLARFERISHNLQAPTADEHPITLDGTHLTPDMVARALRKNRLLPRA